VARLSALSAETGDHWRAMDIDADLIELRTFRDHYYTVFRNNPSRTGTPENLALMAWTGLNIKVRLPFVFETLGMND
jgi:hypothetical protein